MKNSLILKMMILMLLALGSRVQAQTTYRIEQIGPDPNPPEVYFYFVNDLNDNGEVIGGAYPGTSPFWSWLWRDGEFIRLPGLPGAAEPAYVYANGMNDRTQIVGDGGTADPAIFRPFIWQQGQTRELQPLASIGASPVDLNNLGMIVAAKSVDGAPVPFVQWGRHSLQLESLPGSNYTYPTRINELGMVIGNATTDSFTRTRAVIWKLGKIQDIGVLPGGYDSRAYGLNDRGEAAVQVRFGPYGESSRAALWTGDHLVELPLYRYGDFTRARATGINNAGTVVGDVVYQGGDADPLMWKDGAVYNLNDLIRADDPSRPYVRLQQAVMINNRGQIVATGVDARKPPASQNFLLTPSGHL